MARLALVREQISSIEKTRAERLERAPDTGPHAMVRLLARVIGVGIETADMLVHEILSRNLARSKSGDALRRAYGIARRERFETPERRAWPRLAMLGTTWADPAGVALPGVREGQCAGAVVSHADRGPSGARKTTMIISTGAQAADSAVALGHHRRGTGRCRAAAGFVSSTR